MASSKQNNKALIIDYYNEIEKSGPDSITQILSKYMSDDCHWYGVHPFNEQIGPTSIAQCFWHPFFKSFTRIQRRQDVFMAGENDEDGSEWVTSMGHFMVQFDNDWLGIPRSGKVAMLRYADFNCVKNGKIVRSGFFIDIIGLMLQVGINPLPESTGHAFVYPGPLTHNGMQMEEVNPIETDKTMALLNNMIEDFAQLNKTANDHYPISVLQRSWHEDMIWYGPAGIGATFGIKNFQEQHSYPFRQGLKDKVFNGHICRFAEGSYACFFGWPNLSNTPIGGFLGLPGGQTRADMRVVDVYRRAGDKLIENWVLIDLPYWLKQQGLDILARNQKIRQTTPF